MADHSWTVLDDALVRALDLDVEPRAAYVAGLDPATREALEPLLRDALANDPLLDHPHATFARIEDAAEARAFVEGARVGPYRIEALAGEGGMGRVFRARRADGLFDQTVAVKVVRHSLTLAGSDVSARLRRERDLLAALDHVGIARLLDGGETEDGVPYLVTEFIDGMVITDYADANGLDVAARVGLMVDVARAVDHAHRRFVVHRDLKPSNVLVAERDGAPRPVVLDFGIAKLLDAADEASGAFPLTRTGVRMLTPAYAAPELYDPATAVTTAADVYGLGALLYELLTGRRPHDDPSATGPATTEPTRPSKVVTALHDGAPAPSGLAARARTLRGDLDTICLRALHPDPARRYALASALADDLERYLTGRPVEARRDSAAYVARRFVRRHRSIVTAAALALVALVVGLGASLASLRSERLARADAETASQRATEAVSVLAGLLQNATPTGDGRPVTVREALDRGLARVNTVESDSLRAYLLGIVGATYTALSEPQRGDSLLAVALALYGDAASDSTVSNLRITYASTRDAFADYETSLALGRRVYADQEASGFSSSLAVRALSVMSRAQLALGQTEEGIRLATEAVALARAHGDGEFLARALISLGTALSVQGRYAEALRTHREAVRQCEVALGPDAMRTYTARTMLAETLLNARHPREAEALFRRVEAYEIRAKGEGIGLSYIRASLGSAMLQQEHFGEAAAILDSAVTLGRRTLPPGHPVLAAWLTDLASARNGSGAYTAAESAASEALARAERASDVDGARLARAELDRARRRSA